MCDPSIVAYAKKNSTYSINVIHGGGKSHQLVCKYRKIVIPILLQHHIVNWYHMMLCNPGAIRMENFIWQNLTWKTLSDDINKECKIFHMCQTNKCKITNYGHLPVEKNELQPWNALCVDII